MNTGIKIYYILITIIIPAIGIIIGLSGDKTKILKDTCNRYCHNKGCPHETILPDYISGNNGYFGDVIRLLKDAGGIIENILNINAGGYLIANLLIFCFIIPVIHILFWIINLHLIKDN